MNLETLEKIFGALGLSFQELGALMPASQGQEFELSVAQEFYFAEEPTAFNLFQKMLAGKSVQRKEQSHLLRKMEALKILERHPGGRIVLKVRGQLRLRKEGPLEKKYKKAAIADFLDQAGLSEVILGYHPISSADFLKLRNLIEEPMSFARIAEMRSRFAAAGDLHEVGLLVGLAPFRPKRIGS